MNVQTWLTLGLVILAFGLWGSIVVSLRREAFKWRNRWNIERFHAGVEGTAGDYFIISAYATAVPCFIFSKCRKDLLYHATTIREWNSYMGVSFIGENCDLPDEQAVGLPENPARDTRT